MRCIVGQDVGSRLEAIVKYFLGNSISHGTALVKMCRLFSTLHFLFVNELKFIKTII